MAFTLPDLPYAYDALEPYIDEQTMVVHHTKHHQTYVDKLNAALEGHDDLLERPIHDLLRNLDDVPENVRTAVRNNGGGHYNHSLFWKILSPDGGGSPVGQLMSAIERSFGTFAAFRQSFTEAALTSFGSGWTWLSIPGGMRRLPTAKNLAIVNMANQMSPVIGGSVEEGGVVAGNTPVLGIDLWEHAYYLKYQNRRAEYIEAFWNLVNWDEASRLYETAK
jgi:superoxide dismutase, Fe-Mn family